MRINKLIKKLENIKKVHGNLECVLFNDVQGDGKHCHFDVVQVTPSTDEKGVFLVNFDSDCVG